MITRICTQCGQPYETFPSRNLRYCSKPCASIAKKNGQDATCAYCGQAFYKRPSKPDHTYCSISCGISARNLTDANPSYHRDITGPNNPMYGVHRFGSDNPMYGRTKDKAPRWTGGKKVRKDGYTLVVAADDHPYPADSHSTGLKYILEHRAVMEKHLGRYLLPGEVVHHIDKNPRNNALENLQLFPDNIAHMRAAHKDTWGKYKRKKRA